MRTSWMFLLAVAGVCLCSFGDAPLAAVEWGIPLEGGAIRALFVGPMYTLQEADELGKRIELEYETAAVLDSEHLGPEKFVETLRTRVDESYDVIVVGNVDLSILPEDVVGSLLRRVDGGTGLVLARFGGNVPEAMASFLDAINPEDAADIVRGIGEKLTPEWESGLEFVSAGTHGNGRVVELDYGEGRPFCHFLLPRMSKPLEARESFLDVYYSLIAKAVRWAAGRDDAIWVHSVVDTAPQGPDESEIPPDLPDEYIQQIRDSVVRLPYQQFAVGLNAPSPKTYTVRVQVRELERGLRVEYPNLRPLKKGEDEYLVEVPLGPGRYLLDLWLLDGKKVCAWHTEVIEVEGWPEMSDVGYSKDVVLPNDVLTISVNVAPHLGQARPCRVYARGIDSLGRLVSEGTSQISAEGGLGNVTLRFADLISGTVRVEVFALDAPGQGRPSRWELERADYAHREMPVRTQRAVNRFDLVVDGGTGDDRYYGDGLSEYGVRDHLRTLRRVGVDSVYAPACQASVLYTTCNGLQLVPEVARYVPDDETDGMRQPCLNDADYRKSEAERVRDRAALSWATGPVMYSLGRGNRLANAEEVCVCSACADGFRRALTAKYKMIEALNQNWGTSYESFEEITPSSLPTPPLLAAWLDFRLYMDRAFTLTHTLGRDVVRWVDADGRVGFLPEQGYGPHLGYDWYALTTGLDAMAVGPDPLTVERVRSFRNRGTYSALAVSGSALSGDPAWAAWLPWYQVMHGMQGLWVSPGFGGSALTGGTPVLDPDGQPSTAFRALSSSVGELKSGIGALLLNAVRERARIAIYDSHVSEHLAHFLDMRSPADGQGMFVSVLEDLGYQYDIVSSEQVISGKLLDYAVVVLPRVWALDDMEMAALEACRAKGGLLIADVVPGQYTEHGARREGCPLDQVFKRADRAVLLDVQNDEVDDETVGAALGRLLRDHKVPPTVALHKGDDFDGERVVSQYGAATLVTLLRKPDDGGKRVKVGLAFPKQMSVYEVRAGKRFRRPEKVFLDLRPGEPGVVAALPYEVAGVQITAPKSIRPGDRLPISVTIDTRGDLPGTHLVHISVLAGDGHLVDCYELDMVCEKGSGSTYVPLAYDEAPGTYTIRVYDVMTGVSSQVLVRVERIADMPRSRLY